MPGGPSAPTPPGMAATPGYNPAVMQHIMALDPQLGLRLQQMISQRQQQAITMQHMITESRLADQKMQQGQLQELNQAVLPIKQMALMSYQRALDQSGDPKVALRAGQDAYFQGLQTLPTGQYTQDQLQQLRSWRFNPDLARAQVYGSKFAPPHPYLQITGPDAERQVVTDPVTGETRAVSPDVPRFRQGGSGTAPRGPTGAPSKGWQFYQDPDTHALYRLNANAGLSQRLTNGGWVDDQKVDPAQLKRMGGQSSGFGSSLNQRFVNRVIGASNEGEAALISIAGMTKPNSGLFSAASVAGAGGKSLLKGVLTPEAIKRYNATIAGLAPEIASAQNQGLAANDAQIQSIEQAITIGPTDDLKTKQYRVALAARYLRKALETSMLLGTPDQKTAGTKLLKSLERFPDPNAIIDGSWQQGMFNQGKRRPPTAVGKPPSASPATSKGQVGTALLQQYATQHGLSLPQATSFLKGQGYDVQGQ